jgi:polysaccharide biosynthesis protein PslG
LSLDKAIGSHYLEPMRQAGASSAARLLLALVLVCVGSTAVGPTSFATARSTAPEAGRLPPDFFGINAQWLNHLTQQSGDAALVRHVSEMRRLGIETVRAGPQWDEVEPDHPLLGDHRFDFSSFDREMRVLARFRIRASMLLIGTPRWAREPGAFSCGWQLPPPRSAEDFARYAVAVAARYGRGGSFWSQHPRLHYLPVIQFEIWNEPNLWDFWCPEINPQRYADMFTESALALHGVDPRARVVVGGLVAFDRTHYWPNGTVHGMEVGEFLSQVFAHRPDAREQIDAVGLHTYGETPAVHLSLLRYTRRRLRQIGLGQMPIVYNEFGWTTSGAAGFVASDRTRARYLRKITTYAARGTCGVIEVDPYAWATDEVLPQDSEDWYGIVDPETAQPYASARTYSKTLRWLRGELSEPAPGGITTCR